MRARKLLALGSAVVALGLVAGCGGDDEPSNEPASGGSAEESGGTIKVGFLSDCEGAFGSFFEPTISGANLALIKNAGAKAGGEKPSDGVTGAKVAGKDARDRRLWLRGRHGRQGDRGDAPPDGAGGRGRARRTALG